MTVSRGTSNSDDRGSAEARRQRKTWLFEVWAANVDLVTWEEFADLAEAQEVESTGTWILLAPLGDGVIGVPEGMVAVHPGLGHAAVRCFRCGTLCTWETVEIDRIKPGCEGGKYTRNNIRPCCPRCNTWLGAQAKKRKAERRAKRAEQQRAYRARRKAAAARARADIAELGL